MSWSKRLALLAYLGQQAALADPPEIWVMPLEPLQITGDLNDVGSQDLASYLVVTSEGNTCSGQSDHAEQPPLLQIKRDLLDRASELEGQLVSEIHRGANVLADIHTFAEGELDRHRLWQ